MAEQRPEKREPRNTADRAARSTIGGESTAFGFSILITATFGAVQAGHGSPSYTDLLLFALCASATFGVLEGLVSRGYRESMPEYKSYVQTPGTAMNVVSVVGGLAAAIGLAVAIHSGVAWEVCPFAAVVVYIAAETIEQAVAERIQVARGLVDEDEVARGLVDEDEVADRR